MIGPLFCGTLLIMNKRMNKKAQRKKYKLKKRKKCKEMRMHNRYQFLRQNKKQRKNSQLRRHKMTGSSISMKMRVTSSWQLNLGWERLNSQHFLTTKVQAKPPMYSCHLNLPTVTELRIAVIILFIFLIMRLHIIQQAWVSL